MYEIATSLNLDFNKILIQIVCPGIVASFPYILIYLHYHLKAKTYFYHNSSVLITSVILIALVAGLIIENLGGLIEVYYYDKSHKKLDTSFTDTWNKYLQLNIECEPIGQRYLRNILMRMKFELSMGVSLVLMTVGLFMLDNVQSIISSCYLKLIFIIILPLVTSAYLILYEGKNSSRILADTRKILVDKFYK